MPPKLEPTPQVKSIIIANTTSTAKTQELHNDDTRLIELSSLETLFNLLNPNHSCSWYRWKND